MKTLTALESITLCREFIGKAQFQAMRAGLRGEESQHFQDKFMEYGERIANMPKTYETEEMASDEKTAWLHYFAGGQASWWIIEKDAGAPDSPGQHQAFGLADLFGDGGELGYISIVEILANGGELDLYFRPCTLAELRLKQTAKSERPQLESPRHAGEYLGGGGFHIAPRDPVTVKGRAV